MNLRILVLDFDFAMIHMIHKILILIKDHLNYLKYIFKFFFKKYSRLLVS